MIEPQIERRNEAWQKAAAEEPLTLEPPFPYSVISFDPEFFKVTDDPPPPE